MKPYFCERKEKGVFLKLVEELKSFRVSNEAVCELMKKTINELRKVFIEEVCAMEKGVKDKLNIFGQNFDRVQKTSKLP